MDAEADQGQPSQQYNVYNFGEASGTSLGAYVGIPPSYPTGPGYYYSYPYGHFCGSPAPGSERFHVNHSQPQPPSTSSDTTISYRVRVINPKNKRDFMELTWHGTTDKFHSVSGLKQKLIDSFPEYIPSMVDFQVGYLEGRGNQKRWIVRAEDLVKMYESVYEGDVIKLWCEGKGKEQSSCSRKRKTDDEEERQSKRDKKEEHEREIRDKLEEKHGTTYSVPQYSLWAKFIKMGRHESYETPPPIPLLTGTQKGRPQRKEAVSDVIIGAATAFAQALKPSSPSMPSTPSTPPSKSVPPTSLSPNNQANLRRRYLEDLRTLSQLHDDGVLTSEEFQEQKDKLLLGLRKL